MFSRYFRLTISPYNAWRGNLTADIQEIRTTTFDSRITTIALCSTLYGTMNFGSHSLVSLLFLWFEFS